ncbi:hypothetical protein ACIQ9E_06465 [Streptomyces sp. NPDC094448]|uniref:hypothetical protein n=1 Tax=Streptomyces sp. NPDC094448 TaxID=3366063 RepID=UPI0038137E1C
MGSMLVGLIVSVVFVALDASTIMALSAGGGALAFVFLAGITALSYIKHQG